MFASCKVSLFIFIEQLSIYVHQFLIILSALPWLGNIAPSVDEILSQ